MEWPVFADDIDAILALKRRRNAVILAHNYQTPEIFHCVADIVGDSLALAREAMKVDAEVIVLAGVHFMAETAKLLNPAKTVLIPDSARRLLAGRVDHRGRRAPAARALPGVPVVTYVNTIGGGEGGVRHLLHLRQRAQGHRIARRRPGDHAARRVPGAEHRRADRGEDHHLGRPLRGARALHRRRDPRSCAPRTPAWWCWRIPSARPRWWPRPTSPARPPTCRAMSASKKPARVVLITECSMADNVSVHHPDVEFVRPCNLCPHMKRITLANIRTRAGGDALRGDDRPRGGGARPPGGRAHAGGQVTFTSPEVGEVGASAGRVPPAHRRLT